MEWTIPGTVLTAHRDQPESAQAQISSMFLAGGMVRSQVAAVTGLESHAVQNWVKRGFLSPPVGKRYTCRQFCRIVIINMLKGVLPMEKICALLSYVNGKLDTESDDSIDDSQLYFAFLHVAANLRDLAADQPALKEAISESLAEYSEPYPGAKQRVEQVLLIMLTAWASAQLQREAENLFTELNFEKGE